jgi:hypothetical protein
VSVTVILDATAILAYARLEGVAVGELIRTVDEDGDLVGVPVLVLVDVWPVLDQPQREMVTDLISREGGPVVGIPMYAEQVPAVADAARQVGYAVAQTVAAARELGATLATYDPATTAGLLDPYDVLTLS